jgi:hypothetical protein
MVERINHGVKVMKRSVSICLTIAVGLIFAPLSSQAASPQKVHEFFEVMGMQKMMSDLIPTMTKSMVASIAQAHPGLPPDVPDIVSQVVNETMLPLLPQMQAATEKLYAENLTDDEVNGALAFYRTPVGQSLLKKMPAMTQQGMQAGQAIIATHIPEMQQRLVQELQKRHPDMK